MDFLLLIRRDLALEPYEATLRRQAFAYFGRIEIRKHRSEQFDRFVHIDDLAWLGKQRRCLDVGRENFAVTIENVGACGGDGILRDAAPSAVALPDGRKHNAAYSNNRSEAREC